MQLQKEHARLVLERKQQEGDSEAPALRAQLATAQAALVEREALVGQLRVKAKEAAIELEQLRVGGLIGRDGMGWARVE